jgi:hypothetical protein
MIDLECRLTELGGLLDLPADPPALTGRPPMPDVAGVVLERLADRRAGHRVGVPWKVAAAVVLLAVGVAIVVPQSRDVVSGWLGLDRVTIERREDGSPPTPSAPPPTGSLPREPGPDGSLIVVDGRAVLVAELDGRLSDVMITKTLAPDAPVRALDIDGAPALWIESTHDVLIEVDGAPVVERVAGSTLLWQDGDVLRRIEGFETLDDAIEYARSR